MSNLFDSLQRSMVNTVAQTMGYDATWTPTAGGVAQSARVLYNGPTEKERLFSADYDPDKLYIEYQEGEFTGLFEAATAGNEVITVTSIGEFVVKGVDRLYDGNTYRARLVRND